MEPEKIARWQWKFFSLSLPTMEINGPILEPLDDKKKLCSA